jgi:RNA polymerase sigma-70 factor (ECF subfamily)
MNHELAEAAAVSCGKGLFPKTLWTVVLRAKGESVTAMNTLLGVYRPALVTYLRASGKSPHDAEDLVQGFMAHLLARDFLAGVGPEKGKFRTFLLRSLNHYLCDHHDKQNALKRGGGQKPTSLDETDPEGQPLHVPADLNPAADLEYDRAWARTLLDTALRRLEAECAPTRHTALAKALEPVLFGDEDAGSYREIAARFGMSEAAVKMAVLRLRARLRGLIREEVLQTVGDEAELEGELRYLVNLFGKER